MSSSYHATSSHRYSSFTHSSYSYGGGGGGGSGSSSSSSRATASTIRPQKSEDWEPYRDAITQLYGSSRLKEVMADMQAMYGFKATEKQYKTQIKKWNLDTKYTKASEYVAMIKTQKRRERENPGKQTRFTLRGRPIDPRDIARFEKRAMKKGGVNFEEAEEGGGYIEDLEYETPSPTASVASLDAQSPSTYVHSPSEGLSPKSHLFSYAPYPPPTARYSGKSLSANG
ncbi:hypothetical protein P8C59_000699 [Phyllachora maydis]|uniref:Clr5 domain-containing protein n=1 Tax=Phyllachora maydis TaxID=1825666 RepID=A0AAD9HWX9_9PEZI|nr:hypothetical protein P8C59_000699 [Phyllachora maydis]